MGLFKKEEIAKVIEWNPKWDTGAPNPQIFSNGTKIYLIYLIDILDPNWNGTYIKEIDSSSEVIYPLALVEFKGSSYKFGIANNEVFAALPLSKKGLKPYEAHIIENSSWLNEIKSIHKIHPHFDERIWDQQKHYMLLFHDELLEVIATGYTIEKFSTTFKLLASEVASRLNS